MKEASITFVVPAYNEAANLAGAVDCVRGAAEGTVTEFRVLIVDDGSGDGTGELADSLARSDARVSVLHNGRNRGYGYSVAAGIRSARTDYVMMVPGDNEIEAASIRALLERLGAADVVIPYTANPEVRTFGRELLSRAYTGLVNALFGLRLRYYNGTPIHRSRLIQATPIRTDGFAFQAETLVRLLRSGCSYVQVPMTIRPREGGRSKALRPRNIASVLWTLGRLFLSVHLVERSRYGRKPRELRDPAGTGAAP